MRPQLAVQPTAQPTAQRGAAPLVGSLSPPGASRPRTGPLAGTARPLCTPQLEVVGPREIRVGARRSRVSPQQARLFAVLGAKLGLLVARAELMDAAFGAHGPCEPHGASEGPGDGARCVAPGRVDPRREHRLDVALARLRQALERLGCVLEIERGAGARLEPVLRLDAPRPDVSEPRCR
jgi:hypothetical protein